MAVKISTNNGEFVIIDRLDKLTGKFYYEVYMPIEEECCGEYVGDYTPQFNIDDEYEKFIEDLEMWFKDLEMWLDAVESDAIESNAESICSPYTGEYMEDCNEE